MKVLILIKILLLLIVFTGCYDPVVRMILINKTDIPIVTTDEKKSVRILNKSKKLRLDNVCVVKNNTSYKYNILDIIYSNGYYYGLSDKDFNITFVLDEKMNLYFLPEGFPENSQMTALKDIQPLGFPVQPVIVDSCDNK